MYYFLIGCAIWLALGALASYVMHKLDNKTVYLGRFLGFLALGAIEAFITVIFLIQEHADSVVVFRSKRQL